MPERSRLVDGSKSGQTCPVVGWSILGQPVLVKRDHPKSRFVRISDPHVLGLWVLLDTGRTYNGYLLPFVN
jgi:hypothetical protein